MNAVRHTFALFSLISNHLQTLILITVIVQCSIRPQKMRTKSNTTAEKKTFKRSTNPMAKIENHLNLMWVLI